MKKILVLTKVFERNEEGTEIETATTTKTEKKEKKEMPMYLI